jgi:eukaryotic-like serine/threonine-protein kinase
MDTDRWQRVERLCHAALEREQAQQAAFLESACAGDRALRREVESLLAHRTQAEHFIEGPALDMAAEALAQDESYRSAAVSRLMGRVLSDYRIIEKLGGGGMGDIYRAVRADGTYNRQVAIKIVQSGLNTDYFFARFRNERQILASLDHPNIAKLIDGGSTEEGFPYVVMEYIEGLRIDEYCDAHDLDTNERLGLFLQVCSAVQYAHQRLVIHRDIKPGNILVNAEGVPKLLDFGIAKILESSDSSAQQEQTISVLRLLTPEYASPEQIKGEPITTASDVYSLGVVLYELLAGRTPYNVPAHTPHEVSRAVCEAEPEKPSAVVRRAQSSAGERAKRSQVATVPGAAREGPREKLSKRLSGDLDNIVLMALRKEPHRRYASVEQFAQDIRRHRDYLPVLARKDTPSYRTSKFITRHKAGVAAAVVVAITLLAALGVTVREARIARANEIRAEQRFNDVRKIANSLLFDVHDSIQTLQGATSARKLIVQLGLEYLDRLSAESAGDPSLQKELAAGYQKLGDVQSSTTLGNTGDHAGGIASYRKAVQLREALSRKFPRDWTAQNDLGRNYQVLGQALQAAGNQVESDQYLEKALQISRPLAEQHPNNTTILYSLGLIEGHQGSSLWRQEKTEAALQSYRESAATFSRVGTIEPSNTRARRSVAIVNKHIGGTLEELKRLDEALYSYRLAFNIDQELLAHEPESAMYLRDSTVDLRNLGDVSVKQKRLKEARNYYEGAMAIDRRLVEKDPADRDTQLYLALDHESIGKVFLEMRDAPAAVASFQVAQKIHQERTKADPADADAKFALANNYMLTGDAYALLAQSSTQSLGGAHLQNSCAAYNNSLKVWNAMRAGGALNKLYETYRSSLLAKMQICN